MIKLGICGTNNSHSVAFSRLANVEDLPKEERVEGAKVVAFFAYDDENVDKLNELGVTNQVEKKEDLIPLVDGVLCVTRDGSKHLEEAVPFLEAGVPTFVDKPLAVGLKDGPPSCPVPPSATLPRSPPRRRGSRRYRPFGPEP
jgi:predicted dehydrogenase